MTEYQALVSREGKWWMIHVPGVDGLTQARRLSEAGLMAREFVAVTLDVPVESVTISVRVVEIEGVANVGDRINAIIADRAKADELSRKASADAIALARELASHDVPIRDVGEVLGVSHQRAHQLIHAA
ncbi:hypothetical protein BH11ACT3_BH11ACT3_20490 [soil metagenome]